VTVLTAPPPAGPSAPTAPEAAAVDVSPFRRPPLRLLLIFLMLLTSCVAWRRGIYYSGGLDAVVMAKGMLGLLALVLALTAPRIGARWSELRTGPLPWLVLYLGISFCGAALHGTVFATAVLGARVVLLAMTVVILVRAYPWQTLLSTLTAAMLLLATVGAVTGVGSLASGRLYGGLPPLNANEISLLIGVPLVCIVWRCVNRAATTLEVASVLPLLGVIWLTGTRTGLAALVLSFLLLVTMAPRIPAWLLSICVLSLPAVLFTVFLTPLISTYATRGDVAGTMTLNSRTVAWEAATEYADSTAAQLVGAGLAVKQIPVSAMYRDEQILDSTWMSAIVQAGALGTLTLALMTLVTLGRALALPAPQRSLVFAVLVLLVVRSVLESGLFDASAAFIPFLCLSLAVQQPRRPPSSEAP
jgi:hypothetical protein